MFTRKTTATVLAKWRKAIKDLDYIIKRNDNESAALKRRMIVLTDDTASAVKAKAAFEKLFA
jgi:hypothetical protein